MKRVECRCVTLWQGVPASLSPEQVVAMYGHHELCPVARREAVVPLPGTILARDPRYHGGPRRSHGVNAPDALHRDFAVWCKARGWTANAVLTHWMRLALAKSANKLTLAQRRNLGLSTPVAATDMQPASERLVDDPTELLANREQPAQTLPTVQRPKPTRTR